MQLYPRRPHLSLAALALLCALPAHAASLEQCPAVEVENKASQPALLQKAKAGDACAQFSYGVWHYTRQHYIHAERWYAQAAAQGNARAAFEIAILYRDELLPKDEEKRQSWLEQAANQGLDLAQVERGLDYLENQESEEQQITAMSWFEKAALQGNAQAQYLLGQQYWSDQRGVQDAVMGDELALHYSSSDDKALYWICKAAQNDHPAAQYTLSEAYSQGRGLPNSSAQRLLWLEKAAANGDEQATADLEYSGNPWYYRAEKWLQRKMIDEQAHCPDDQLALEQ